MAGLQHITAEQLAIMQKALGLKLPADYIRFVANHPLPPLTYMSGEDLSELSGLSAFETISFNENLRDPGLNPKGWPEIWKEHYLGLGCHTDNDGVYYLDCEQKAEISSVYRLDMGASSGQLIAGDFTRWAAGLLVQLAQEDERCRQWHIGQQPAWWRWLKGIFKK